MVAGICQRKWPPNETVSAYYCNHVLGVAETPPPVKQSLPVTGEKNIQKFFTPIYDPEEVRMNANRLDLFTMWFFLS